MRSDLIFLGLFHSLLSLKVVVCARITFDGSVMTLSRFSAASPIDSVAPDTLCVTDLMEGTLLCTVLVGSS